MADARQDTIELLERSCETFSQRFNEGVGVDRFAQLLVMQRAAILLAPIAGQIVARIAERMGAFHPNFLAFQRPFQFFKHAQFVVASVNLDRPNRESRRGHQNALFELRRRAQQLR